MRTFSVRCAVRAPCSIHLTARCCCRVLMNSPSVFETNVRSYASVQVSSQTTPHRKHILVHRRTHRNGNKCIQLANKTLSHTEQVQKPYGHSSRSAEQTRTHSATTATTATRVTNTSARVPEMFWSQIRQCRTHRGGSVACHRNRLALHVRHQACPAYMSIWLRHNIPPTRNTARPLVDTDKGMRAHAAYG